MSKLYWKSILALVLVGAIAIVVMSQLYRSHLEQERSRYSAAVFKINRLHIVTDDTLVDLMVTFQCRERLARVTWDHSILAVDLMETSLTTSWVDVHELITVAFSQKNNVEQVLIRLFNGNNEAEPLLLAIETRKDDWKSNELNQLTPTALEQNPVYFGKLRVSTTPIGQRWLKHFAI
ncbi:MAG: hypothetical protein P0Y55_06490 [Candidatus Cohnella colombiensis]|uniref:Uncharacterized protein n=1 Tax=Candidatus Cohnella colombiensis TaxID=3121368 RepID=A0AA95JBQ3_9BACL|nr:MAG: hypothetical protein P0Y55_06490 [Cohnella sp.]